MCQIQESFVFSLVSGLLDLLDSHCCTGLRFSSMYSVTFEQSIARETNSNGLAGSPHSKTQYKKKMVAWWTAQKRHPLVTHQKDLTHVLEAHNEEKTFRPWDYKTYLFLTLCPEQLRDIREPFKELTTRMSYEMDITASSLLNK